MSKLLSIGALPVGLRGKFYGLPFSVMIQYDLEGKVAAHVMNDKAGSMIVSISGNTKNITKEADVIAAAAAANYDWSSITWIDKREKLKRQMTADAKKFVSQLSSEVRDFNSGKVKAAKDKKPKTVNIESPVTTKKPMPKKSTRRKPVVASKAKKRISRKKGSVIKLIDSHGHENRTYKVQRDKQGHYKKFARIAGNNKSGILGAPEYNDPDAVRDVIVSIIENDGEFYQRVRVPIVGNLVKHWNRNKWNQEKAVIAMNRLVNEADKYYQKKILEKKPKGYFLSIWDRKRLAQELAEEVQDELKREGSIWYL